ncbi:disks large-associated protein 5-like [Cloeon dipterum]|uniref:disks large-associated protein 5-like n=1 Tax=Cloeon dipterum TaxID=197152 RepID=UPI00321F8C88
MMQSLREGYKRAVGPTKSGSKQSRVLLTAQQRRQNRSDKFADSRNIMTTEENNAKAAKPSSSNSASAAKGVENVPKRKNMVESLQKWRQEKQRQKELQAKYKRPEFKVSSHVETKSASDIFTSTKKASAFKNVPPKIVSRRDNAPQMQTVIPSKFRFRRNDENALISEFNGTFEFGGAQSKNQAKPLIKSSIKKTDKKAKPSVEFKPDTSATPAGPQRKFPVTPKPLSKSGQNIKAAKSSKSQPRAPLKQYLTEDPLTPSPPKKQHVVIEPTPAVEEIAKPEEIVAETAEGELSTAYFRQILDNEINILEQLCVKWEREMRENGEMTSTAEENVLLATGMARLIIREKFAQFRGLIDNCDHPEDTKTRTLLTDLQGFWDMIKIQSDNIQASFDALEKLKQNGWQEEQVVVKKAAPKRKKKAPAKPVASSRMTQFLAQKKAEKMAQTTKKTPDMKMKGATPKSSAKKSSSSGRKKKCSPNVNALVTVSLIAKSAERKSLDRSANKSLNDSVLDNSTTEFKHQKPRTETPSRSILKKPELTPGLEKNRKCVLFDMIAEEPEEETLELPPVMRTYSNKASTVSPPKDTFDLLLDSVTSSTPVAKSTLPLVPVVEVQKKRSFAKSPHPRRRSSRLSGQTIEQAVENVIACSEESLNTTQEAVRRESRHTNSKCESLDATRDDSFVSKRRSSRKRTNVDEAAGMDFMTFESPGAEVPVKRRKSSRVKKTLLDQSL